MANKEVPISYDLALLAEYENREENLKSVFRKTQESLVVVDIAITKKSGQFEIGPNLVARLPEGFRPIMRKHTTGYSVGSQILLRIYIDPDGSVYVHPNVALNTALGQIVFIADK